MAVTIKHATLTSELGGDRVSASEWDADHDLTGLGTMAEQAASNVAITGGSIAGITDLAVADGGTGASSASAARTNLGVYSTGEVDTLVSGGGSAWSVVDQTGAPTTGSTWTYSSNVANVDVVGLSAYNELLVIAYNIVLSASGLRLIQVSVNNGSSFYSTSGDYIQISTLGGPVSASGFSHESASSPARTTLLHLINTKGDQKLGIVNTGRITTLFNVSASDIDAIRLVGSAAGNITGGSLYVYAR